MKCYNLSTDAAWSRESRSLFPLWEELAQHFSEDEDIVVAKIDVTANDISVHLGEKYPSIKFFPAVYAERVRTRYDLKILSHCISKVSIAKTLKTNLKNGYVVCFRPYFSRI